MSEATLTDEQEQAASRRSGSLLLSAGAGSGKTSVLVERFVRAVRDDGVAPSQILAITFTERAAGELRERVRARLLALGEREAAREAEEAFISTFHGFCARLLRTHPLAARIDPGFRVLEEGISSRLQTLAFGDALRSFLHGEPAAAVDLVAAYGADTLQRMVFGAYAHLRSQGQTEPRLELDVPQAAAALADADTRPRTTDIDMQAAQTCRLIDELLHRFGDAYTERKRARGALDFDDLELGARDLLREHEHVRCAWSERFQMLMVDEFQDTNPRQLELLELLNRDNLFTVGDQLQSIYGFRHAEVELFRERRTRLAERGAALALTSNFRSRPEILAAVERIFGERLGDAYTHLSAARPALQTGEPAVELLLTDCRGWKDEQGAVEEELAQLPDATPWRLAEARALAARISQLVNGGHAAAGDVVVLLRALGDLPVYEAALRAAGLSTSAAVGGFWGHQQVGDLLCYLRALCNPLDELALYGTLASPLVGVSSDGLALISRSARERRMGVWESIEHADDLLDLRAPDKRRVDRFGAWFASERAAAPLHPLAELLRRAIAWSGYDTRVLSLSAGERRLANMHKLLAIARSFEAQEGRDLRGFLDHVAHLADVLAAREADAPASGGEHGAVRLMSIHSAKGLEFPVVCVADLGRAPRRSVDDLLVERNRLPGLRLARLGEPEMVPALGYEQLRAESQAAQQEEEDRILYVSVTRARERLLLSGAADLARWPASKQGAPPIAWVAPALMPQLESLLQAPQRELTVEVHPGLSVRCMLNRPGEEPVAARAASEPSAGRASSPAPVLSPASAPVLLEGSTDACRQSPLSDPDATVSYSSLAELERCGYRYYLERVLRMGERRGGAVNATDGGVAARTRGAIIHMLLERVDFAQVRPPTPTDVASVASRLRVRVSRSEREAIAALVARALHAPLANRIAQGRGARREHPFTFSLGGEHPLVTGVLDLLVHEPDGSALIVDYKSDRLHADENLETVVQSEYGLQRLLYAFAALEAGAERVQVAHWFLERPEEPVLASFAAEHQPALRAQLLERMRGLREQGFSVAQVPHRGICATCPGRGTLCLWGDTHTSRELSTPLESPRRVATLTF
ncbi:MAG: UvrD-helicase domain-containing protein [Solirubrobacteraceae bacterium]